MIGLRLVLAVLMVGIGAVIVVQFLRIAQYPQILIGVVLGVAMVALGVHKVSLALRAWKAQP